LAAASLKDAATCSATYLSRSGPATIDSSYGTLQSFQNIAESQ
jgi:hypothetical protein